MSLVHQGPQQYFILMRPYRLKLFKTTFSYSFIHSFIRYLELIYFLSHRGSWCQSQLSKGEGGVHHGQLARLSQSHVWGQTTIHSYSYLWPELYQHSPLCASMWPQSSYFLH